MLCPTCGSQRPNTDNFCANCGNALLTSTATQASVAAASLGALVGSEYSGLRDEIIKRIELQVQLISITLVAAGAFVGVGLPKEEGDASAATLLAYPVLALFTWATWAFHQLRIIEAAAYIKRLENKHQAFLGWETFLKDIRSRSFFSRNLPFLTFGGLWLSSEIVLLAMGLVVANRTRVPPGMPVEEIVLISLDITAILLTIIMTLVFSIPTVRRLVIGVE